MAEVTAVRPHAPAVRASLARVLTLRRCPPRARSLPQRRCLRLRQRRLLPRVMGLGEPGAAPGRSPGPGGGCLGRARRPGRGVPRRPGGSGRVDRALAAVDGQLPADGPGVRAHARLPRRRSGRHPARPEAVGCGADRRAVVRLRRRDDVRPADEAVPRSSGELRSDLQLPPFRAGRLLERAGDPRRDGRAARPRPGRPERAADPVPRGGIDGDLHARPLLHVQPRELDRVLLRAHPGDCARPQPAAARDHGARAHALVGDRGRSRLDLVGAHASDGRPRGRDHRRSRARRDRNRPGRGLRR